MKDAQPISENIGNEAKRHTDIDRVNNWLATNYLVEVRNAFANYESIRQLRQQNRAHPMQEFQKKSKGRAVILGSGSSLDLYIDRLKDWPGKVFCSSTQASSLVYHDRHPDYLCLVDPNSAPPESPEYDIPNYNWNDTILVTHPSGPWRDVKWWKEKTNNNIYLFRLHDARLEWYRSTLYYAYPWIKSIIIPFLDSTAAQISVAAYLGYDPIYMLGVDYGGPRFRRSIYVKGKWKIDPEVRYEGGSLNYYDAISPEGVGTSPAYLFTKRGPCMCIAMHLFHGFFTRIYTLAPHDRTLMTELPYADFDKIIETKEDPPESEFNTQKVYDDVSIYLAWTNTFAAPIHNGLGKSLAKYAVRDFDDLQGVLQQLNQDLERSRNYYINMMNRAGKTLKEIADSGAVPDEGQRNAMRNIDLDAMQGVNIPQFMERAAAMKAIGNQRYGQKILIRSKTPFSIEPKKRAMKQAEDEYLDAMGTNPEKVAAINAEVIAKDKAKPIEHKLNKENNEAYFEQMKTGPNLAPNLNLKESKHLRKKRDRQLDAYLKDMKASKK